ncbi:UNVERIFIED_CONTAM: hypothetical protein FKN15_000169 [Acipenser sinensis]
MSLIYCHKAANIRQAKSAEMSPKQRKQSVYTPPTMKGSEQTDPLKCNDGESPLLHSGKTQPLLEKGSDEKSVKPRRKDTPFQHHPPFVPGRAFQAHTHTHIYI